MRLKVFVCLAAALLALAVRSVSAQPFTYQAVLSDNGTPINGIVEVTIRAYSAPTGGTLLATSDPMIAELENGLFSSPVDLPGIDWSLVASSGVWLEVEMLRDGQGAPTVLSPRQRVTAAPVAAYALSGPFAPADPEPVYPFSESGLPTGNFTVDTLVSINGGPYIAVEFDGLSMTSFFNSGTGTADVETSASVRRDFDFSGGLAMSEFDNAQLSKLPLRLEVRVRSIGTTGVTQAVDYVFDGGHATSLSRSQRGALTREIVTLGGFTSQTKSVALENPPLVGIPVEPGTREEVAGDSVLPAGGVPRTAMSFAGMSPGTFDRSMVADLSYLGDGPGFISTASLSVNCLTSAALFDAAKADTTVSPSVQYLGTQGSVPQSFHSNSSLSTFLLRAYDDGSVAEFYIISN